MICCTAYIYMVWLPACESVYGAEDRLWSQISFPPVDTSCTGISFQPNHSWFLIRYVTCDDGYDVHDYRVSHGGSGLRALLWQHLWAEEPQDHHWAHHCHLDLHEQEVMRKRMNYFDDHKVLTCAGHPDLPREH